MVPWDGHGDPAATGRWWMPCSGLGWIGKWPARSTLPSSPSTRRAARTGALDLPSGLHADTGRVMGTAVRAELTVSFIGLKPGLFTGRGPELAGTVRFAGLGVPQELATGLTPAARRLDASRLGDWLAPSAARCAQGHASATCWCSAATTASAAQCGWPGRPRCVLAPGLSAVATRPEHVPALLAAGRNSCAAVCRVLRPAAVAGACHGGGCGAGAGARVLGKDAPCCGAGIRAALRAGRGCAEPARQRSRADPTDGS
jgi:hypothetical protein